MLVEKPILKFHFQLMLSKTFYFSIVFLCLVFGGQAQPCNLTIEGHIFDEVSGMPLSYVNVYLQETGSGGVTDENGDFKLDDLCSGAYHLVLSHIGCEAKKFHLDFVKDTVIRIGLLHTPKSMTTVVIGGKNNQHIEQPNSSVNRQTIENNSNQNLSGLLENESGIHLIKNGNGISKPIVHGLYGNRLTILNNGIIQGGQQWGNDHSPEIDPFTADQILVLKGASAIEYGGGNMGSVILVEPKRIPRDPHLHGQFNYVFETNGNGHSANVRLGKYSESLSWRINGTFKRYGDRKTADYFLNNTGIREANFAVQLEKSIKDKLFLDVYASTFNTELGVLSGSHIGSLMDLESALTRAVPFYTEPDFSYGIDAPKQKVSHHLLKTKSKYYFNDSETIELVLAGQVNDRKEFDVRRSGRTDIPALSLLQYTFNSELKYTKKLRNNLNFKIGNQNILIDNTNNPETGTLPLIPDYISWKSGLFSTLSKRFNKTQASLGLRYDFEQQDVRAISNSTPREVQAYDNSFHSIGVLFRIQHDLSKSHSVSFNSGYTTRNPAINELYSNGLHQGVSGIEEGDVNLGIEKALKNTLEYKWIPGTDFSLSALVYFQHFDNYIFLNPQDEFRPTIRGVFPVFKYEQTDANIFGIDISTRFTIANSVFGTFKYSYLRGEDVESDQPLVFMPPNNFFTSLTYQTKRPVRFSEKLILEKTEIELNSRIVLEQKHILPEQDFLAPPSSYALVGLKLSADIIFSHQKIKCFVKADNLLNTKYRDYLNRQRYFADEIGLSVSFGVNYKF